MVITIITDSQNSWFVPYGSILQQELSARGYDVEYVHNKKRIREGGICFILSCTRLIQEPYLRRNNHNIVVHASDLPRGKGYSPLQWQILQGEEHITLTLFEATETLDAGPYYFKSQISFNGTELLDELRDRMARKVNEMCLEFVARVDELIPHRQEGEDSFFKKRNRGDDELDIDRTIREQFNHLRIADNERYPLFFRHLGSTYLLKVSKITESQRDIIKQVTGVRGRSEATPTSIRPSDTAVYDLSVVVPVRDEEKNVPELVRRLKNSIEGLKLSYEIIFVTDLNVDRTLEVLRDQNAIDPRVKVIKLANNLGQHIAAVAGLDSCRGRCAVLMDGDLQDQPEDIPKLYGRLREGFDMVYGIKQRKNESALRNMLSRTFVTLLNRISDFPARHNTSMFRIMSRRMIDSSRAFREHEQTPMGIMALIGLPTSSVIVTSGIRMAGETKYSFLRQINLAIGFLLSFSTKPLRMISMLGFVVSVLSFTYLFIVLLQTVQGAPVMGWPTLVVLILSLGGIQLLSLGVIGEYVGRIFIETKRRPLYIVEEKLGEFE